MRLSVSETTPIDPLPHSISVIPSEVVAEPRASAVCPGLKRPIRCTSAAANGCNNSVSLTRRPHLGILKRFRTRPGKCIGWQYKCGPLNRVFANVRVSPGNNRIGLCDTSHLERLCGPELRNGTGFFSGAWCSSFARARGATRVSAGAGKRNARPPSKFSSGFEVSRHWGAPACVPSVIWMLFAHANACAHKF